MRQFSSKFFLWTFTYLYKPSINYPFNYPASKEELIPPVPILTRYRKEAGIKAFVKKELFDPRVPDETMSSEITVLATSTLCVRLNTLYVSSSKPDLYWIIFICFA